MEIEHIICNIVIVICDMMMTMMMMRVRLHKNTHTQNCVDIFSCKIDSLTIAIAFTIHSQKLIIASLYT